MIVNAIGVNFVRSTMIDLNIYFFFTDSLNIDTVILISFSFLKLPKIQNTSMSSFIIVSDCRATVQIPHGTAFSLARVRFTCAWKSHCIKFKLVVLIPDRLMILICTCRNVIRNCFYSSFKVLNGSFTRTHYQDHRNFGILPQDS